MSCFTFYSILWINHRCTLFFFLLIYHLDRDVYFIWMDCHLSHFCHGPSQILASFPSHIGSHPQPPSGNEFQAKARWTINTIPGWQWLNQKEALVLWNAGWMTHVTTSVDSFGGKKLNTVVCLNTRPLQHLVIGPCIDQSPKKQAELCISSYLFPLSRMPVMFQSLSHVLA